MSLESQINFLLFN